MPAEAGREVAAEPFLKGPKRSHGNGPLTTGRKMVSGGGGRHRGTVQARRLSPTSSGGPEDPRAADGRLERGLRVDPGLVLVIPAAERAGPEGRCGWRVPGF